METEITLHSRNLFVTVFYLRGAVLNRGSRGSRINSNDVVNLLLKVVDSGLIEDVVLRAVLVLILGQDMAESTDTEWASWIKIMAVLMNVPSEFLGIVLGFVADLIETIIQLVPEVAIRMLEVDLALNQQSEMVTDVLK
jgi:hypothetical protein